MTSVSPFRRTDTADEDLMSSMTSESSFRRTYAADDSSHINGTKQPPRKKLKYGKNPVNTISERLLKSTKAKSPESFKNVSDNHLLSSGKQLDVLPNLTTYEERYEFADHLKNLHSEAYNTAGQIVWANKRYSFDMRFLLRRERKIDRKLAADRSAKSSMLINRIASTLSKDKPGCYCGGQVYDLFASTKTYWNIYLQGH
jgi:hypothetical protein